MFNTKINFRIAIALPFGARVHVHQSHGKMMEAGQCLSFEPKLIYAGPFAEERGPIVMVAGYFDPRGIPPRCFGLCNVSLPGVFLA